MTQVDVHLANKNYYRSIYDNVIIQCYCLDCGEQLLGMCTDFPLGNRLTCYSHHSLMMWQVNQVRRYSLLKNNIGQF